MFVFMIMILLFFKFTSEVDDIKPYFDTKKVLPKFVQQVKNPIFENKKRNLEKHKSGPPHLVIEEDPEFPVYKDYQILLDNRDADISAQVKGIKRNAAGKTGGRNDYEINEDNKLKNAGPQNKKYDFYFKFRKKRNTDKLKLKTNLLKRSSFYDQAKEEEQSYYKSLDLKDLSEYRPSHESFLKMSTRRSSQRNPPPTLLFDDYYHEETNHSTNDTSMKIIATTKTVSPVNSKDKGNSQLITKKTTEDVCKIIATYIPTSKGGSLTSKLDSKQMSNASSDTLDINTTLQSLKPYLTQKIENSSINIFNKSNIGGTKFSVGLNSTQSSLTAKNLFLTTNSPPSPIKSNRNREKVTKNMLLNNPSTSVVNNRITVGLLNRSSPSNVLQIAKFYKKMSESDPISKNNSISVKQIDAVNITRKPFLENLSVNEDIGDIILLKSEILPTMKNLTPLPYSSANGEKGNLSRPIEMYCKELSQNLDNTANYTESETRTELPYKQTVKSQHEKFIKHGNVSSVSRAMKSNDTHYLNISDEIPRYCHTNKKVTRKTNRYTIIHQQEEPRHHITHDSIYYAFHQKTTLARRAFTFYFVAGTTTHAPERKLDALFKKLTNHSLVHSKSSTKSSMITLRHKEPCNEVEEVSTKPIIQRVLDMVPKPTDKILGGNTNRSAAAKHNRVYPIRHKGGDPGNHYYHGKRPHSVCNHKDFNSTKNKTENKHGPFSDMSDELELTSNSQNTTKNPSKAGENVEPFIAKRKFGQARGKNVTKIKDTNRTLTPDDKKYCTVQPSNDIKEILPQRLHKEYFTLTIQPMQFPTPVTSISKVKKKPKEKFYLCSANKTNIVKP